MRPKRKRQRSQAVGLWNFGRDFFSLKIICWMRIQNICLFSPIQTSIMLPQKTQNSEGPGLSYWENHLKCWQWSRANSGDPSAYSNHSLSFLDLNHYHFYGTNRMLSIDMQTNVPTVATVFIFHVLCKPEFWKASRNLIHSTFNEFTWKQSTSFIWE